MSVVKTDWEENAVFRRCFKNDCASFSNALQLCICKSFFLRNLRQPENAQTLFHPFLMLHQALGIFIDHHNMYAS